MSTFQVIFQKGQKKKKDGPDGIEIDSDKSLATRMGHLDFFKTQASVTPVWAKWQVSTVAWRKLHL